jgi:Na+/melibiose symporter-like transporter
LTSSDQSPSDKTTDPHTVSAFQIGAFCLPAIPISALGLPLVVHLPNFYAEEIGLAAFVGLILMVARFWDVFTDPVLGIVSDRFPTKYGRRRHWIVIAVPIIMLAVWRLFMPPVDAGVLYLAIWMFFLYVGWTLLTISHMSWGAELSPYYHERSRIQGWREFCLVAGMFLVLAMPAIMEAVYGEVSRRQTMFAMGMFVIILLPIGVLLATTQVGERKTPDPKPMDWRAGLRIIVSNGPLRYLLAADLFQSIATGITGTLYFWITVQVMQLGEFSNQLLLAYFVSGAVGVPLWIRASYRFGKHRTFSFAMFYGGLTLPIIFFIPPGSYWFFLIGLILYGIAYGAGSFLLRAIMADVNDIDALESGHEKTGLFFSLLSLTNKIGLAISVGISLTLLDVFGIQSGDNAQNTESALLALRLIYVVPSALLLIAAGAVMYAFPFGEDEQNRLRLRLAGEKNDPDVVLAKSASASLSTTPNPQAIVHPAAGFDPVIPNPNSKSDP